jgi:hypothetical protein
MKLLARYCCAKPGCYHQRCAGRRPQSWPQPGRHLRQLSRHQRQRRQGCWHGLPGRHGKGKNPAKLADFKSGDKPATIMHQISKGYTEEQLDLIATYFAAQK